MALGKKRSPTPSKGQGQNDVEWKLSNKVPKKWIFLIRRGFWKLIYFFAFQWYFLNLITFVRIFSNMYCMLPFLFRQKYIEYNFIFSEWLRIHAMISSFILCFIQWCPQGLLQAVSMFAPTLNIPRLNKVIFSAVS